MKTEEHSNMGPEAQKLARVASSAKTLATSEKVDGRGTIVIRAGGLGMSGVNAGGG